MTDKIFNVQNVFQLDKITLNPHKRGLVSCFALITYFYFWMGVITFKAGADKNNVFVFIHV